MGKKRKKAGRKAKPTAAAAKERRGRGGSSGARHKRKAAAGAAAASGKKIKAALNKNGTIDQRKAAATAVPSISVDENEDGAPRRAMLIAILSFLEAQGKAHCGSAQALRCELRSIYGDDAMKESDTIPRERLVLVLDGDAERHEAEETASGASSNESSSSSSSDDDDSFSDEDEEKPNPKCMLASKMIVEGKRMEASDSSSSSSSGGCDSSSSSSDEMNSVRRAHPDSLAPSKQSEHTSNQWKGDAQPASTTAMLPVEVWALILHYLQYSDVLHMCAVNRTFLNDVMPLLEEVHIGAEKQLHIAPTHRFPNVTLIWVNCLLRSLPYDSSRHIISREASVRIVPFLACFPNLDEAYFIGTSVKEDGITSDFMYDAGYCASENAGRDFMTCLVRSFCGAYCSGLLDSQVFVGNLCCPSQPRYYRRESSCALCREICNSFPVRDVAAFECCNADVARSNISLDASDCRTKICLSGEERLSILNDRPGGREIISEDETVLNLLDCVSRLKCLLKDGTFCWFYFYNGSVMSDLQALHKYWGSFGSLNASDVTDALTQGIDDFGKDQSTDPNEDPMKPKLLKDTYQNWSCSEYH